MTIINKPLSTKLFSHITCPLTMLNFYRLFPFCDIHLEMLDSSTFLTTHDGVPKVNFRGTINKYFLLIRSKN